MTVGLALQCDTYVTTLTACAARHVQPWAREGSTKATVNDTGGQAGTLEPTGTNILHEVWIMGIDRVHHRTQQRNLAKLGIFRTEQGL